LLLSDLASALPCRLKPRVKIIKNSSQAISRQSSGLFALVPLNHRCTIAHLSAHVFNCPDLRSGCLVSWLTPKREIVTINLLVLRRANPALCATCDRIRAGAFGLKTQSRFL